AAPITVSARTTMFVGSGRTELQERDIRVNGLAFGGRRMPRLPIIEPERVASPPLTITLTDVYRYRLVGEAPIDDVGCYVVAFEPRDTAGALFRGRAWIAKDGFGIVRVSAAQTGLRGPIVASEQVDDFTREREGVWLLKRSDVRQMYEGAAHRTPIHRVLDIEQREVNPPGFSRRRQEAYGSGDLLLRDTPQGYRYLQGQTAPTSSASTGEPTIAGRSDRLRTLVGGVIIDPNISRPLPFAGLSYLDFNLFGSGAQLSAFFGGTYGQISYAQPALLGS